MSSAVSVSDLRKAYGEVEAVRGISFEIASGEIFGLLGPNGAGKTTTVEILEGYRERDGGSVTVLGADPAKADQRWREQIGVVLQSSAMYQTLTVAESLALFAGYYERPRSVDEVVQLIGRRLAQGQTMTDSRVALGDRIVQVTAGAAAAVGTAAGLVVSAPVAIVDPKTRQSIGDQMDELGRTVADTTAP